MKAQYSRIVIPGVLTALAMAAVNAQAQAAPAPPIVNPPPVAAPTAPTELEPFAAPGAPATAAPAPLNPTAAPITAPATPVNPPIIPVTPLSKHAILAPVSSGAGPAGLPGRITGTRVNARGKSTIFSHPVFQLQKGEPVNVLEEISLATPKAGEPKKWLRIQVPGDVGLWVHSSFIDLKTTTVKATQLNVRSGPGDNFPILCQLPQGFQVRATPNKVENWQEILAPPQSSVYVAAQFVTSGEPQATPGVVTVPAVTPNGQPTSATPATPNGPPSSVNITVPLNALTQPKVEIVTPPTQPAPPIAIKANPLAGLRNQPKDTSGGDETPPGNGDANPANISETRPEPPNPTKPETATPAEPANVAETNPDQGGKTEVKPDEPLFAKSAAIPDETEPEKASSPPEKPSWITQLLAKSPKDKANPVKIEPLPGTEKENLPVRIVRREGVLQRTLHIQAPSSFVLENLETGKTMNFLYTANTRIPDTLLKKLRGRHVVVTGEEAIEPRWQKTPMLIIQTIKTLDSVADNN